MASPANSGIAKMIVQYDWILENVEEEPMTIASKMILFRGERVFRVGLKNHKGGFESAPVLCFMAINLNKIGMKVEEVFYGIQDSGIGPTTMTQMKQEIISDGSLQFFNVHLEKQVTGNTTFVFRICIKGNVPGFSYRVSDRLVKDQLWDVASKSKNWADVEFVVKGKTFTAHKAILAARSPVFAAEFTKEQQRNDQPVQIHVDGVDPSTVEQFLHFIYTGESTGTFANEELLKLAVKYQLTTLTRLCRTALEKIKPMQMVKLATNLNKEDEILSSKIRPDKETEIFFDRTTPTFRCAFSFENLNNSRSPISVMQYQNEDIFLSDFTGQCELNGNGTVLVPKPVIHLLCPKLCSFGLKIEDIYCKCRSDWYKMESKNLLKNVELQRFTAQPLSCLKSYFVIYFDIKIISTIGNYYYELMDDAWMKDFWTAATNQKFTDVEIFVGTVKLMEAHRVILSARSPVLNASLRKINNTGKSTVTFGAEFDIDIVEIFLKFLYSGSLDSSASHKQLLELATTYKVETLKSMCQLANGAPLDVEDLTSCLLQL